MTIGRAASAAAAALVPARCAGCGAAGAWLCDGCAGSLEPRSVRAGTLPIRAAGAYEGPLRDALHRFKYRGERALAAELGAVLGAVVARDVALGVLWDALVPVPLHRDRVRARGYDQTALLASCVAERTGIPVAAAIRRIRHARPQVELGRDERARNVDGAFAGCAGSLRGLRVAVVDDVATTGATCAGVARAARACGARAVAAYVVALDE